MPTYQVIAPKANGGRLSQAEFQLCISALQAKNLLEKANGCTLLSYAWTANASTCFMIIDSKTHFGLSAFLSRILPAGVDLELKVEPLVTMQEMQQAIYQNMQKANQNRAASAASAAGGGGGGGGASSHSAQQQAPK